ncbi:hypothetical protein [Fusobacterium sp. PH5-44]|uniref:hypothetical protein n=1 Tax=unclassified Fusobacterium TaxID=2648384 RepID=UPI003D1E06A2
MKIYFKNIYLINKNISEYTEELNNKILDEIEKTINGELRVIFGTGKNIEVTLAIA